MNRKHFLLVALAMTALATVSPAAAQVETTINYNVSDVESVAFDCDNSDCSSVSSTFSGSYPNGQTTSTGQMEIEYPADLKTHGYAEYHFAEGYVPMEYHVEEECPDGSPSCSSSHDVGFYKLNSCSAQVDSFSLENDIYKNEPVVANVTSSMDGDVQSAFEDADTGVNYVPDSYKEEYYSARTNVTLKVFDDSGNKVYTDEEQRNIYMSDSEQAQFSWEPSQKGNHTVEVETEVVDSQCASSEKLSTSKETTVHEERPQNEYYTLVNDLEVQRDDKQAGTQHTFKFTKISNYADGNYDKTPVKTDATYTVKDGSGTAVYSNTTELSANSNSQNAEWYSLSWTPSSEGSYSVSVEGISVESQGDHPTSPDSQTVEFEVDPQPKWDVDFTVSNSNADRVKDASISMNGSTQTTDVNGEAGFSGLVEGYYVYEVLKDGYTSTKDSMLIESDTADPLQRSVTIQNSNTAPSIQDIPDKQLVSGTSNTEIDLDEYVSDEQSLDSEISWSYSKSDLSGVTVDIRDDRTVRLAASDTYTGEGTVTFTAEDPQGETDFTTMTVTVTDSNTAPEVTQSIPDVNMDEDQNLNSHYYLGNYFKDAETEFQNLNVKMDVDSEKCGITKDSDEKVHIDPWPDFYGSCTATVTVADPHGATATESFTVNVESVNDAPEFTSNLEPRTVEALTKHSFDLPVEDVDDELSSLSYTANGPDSLSVDENGVVKWIPGSEDVGTHTVDIKVSDGQTSTTGSYEIEVIENSGNSPPLANFSVNATEGGAPLTVSFNASNSGDSDGSIASYSWDFGDGGTATGKTASYEYSQPGVYEAELTVKDDYGSYNRTSVSINVTGNSAPYFTSTPDTKATEGSSYSYDADAKDDEGDLLEYSLEASPSGMSIDSTTGEVSWTPSSSGDYAVEIKASDGKLSSVQFYTISVESESSGGDNGDSDGGGGGGSSASGGGGGSYSLTTVSTEKTLEDRVKLEKESLDLSIDAGSVLNSNFTLNLTRRTRLEIGVEGSIAEIIELPEYIEDKGIVKVPVNVSSNKSGSFNGSITFSRNDESISVPVSIEIAEPESEGELRMSILTGDTTLSNTLEYSVKVWDELRPESDQPVVFTTKVISKDGEVVYEKTDRHTVGSEATLNYVAGELDSGEYKIQVEAEHDNKTYESSDTVQVGEGATGGSITASFMNAPSALIDAVSGVIDGLLSIFS